MNFSHIPITRRALMGSVAAVPLAGALAKFEWLELFDGHSLEGWRPSENKDSWKIVDGTLAANGPRSHLFYTGSIHAADFRNFELEVELITQPGCNSGVYFHTAYQETGFPEKGFEIQVNNTAEGEHGYLERKRTGSLYGLRNVYKQMAQDRTPFRLRATVRGKNIQVHINNELVVDYVEPTPPVIPAGGEHQRFLDHGTFALQCHNDGSRAAYRSVRVRPLPDDLPAYAGSQPVVDDVFRQVIDIGRHNLPMVDYDVRLHRDLPLEQALKKSRADGIQYGIVADGASIKHDAQVERWLKPLEGRPVFLGYRANGAGWTHSISRTAAQRFDYIVADVTQASELDQVLQRIETEPIDILTLPADSESWSGAQRDKLLQALVKNQVAIELNTLRESPSATFIEPAKQAGCKFAFGTANRSAAELKRLEYGLRMVETCKLSWRDFFVPGSWWPKATERRWPA